MTASLLDANAAERLRGRVNSDPEFKLVSRDMTVNLALEIDGEGRLIKVRDGELRTIAPFVPMTEPVDIYIRGGSEFWRLLLSPVPPPRFQNLYQGCAPGLVRSLGTASCTTRILRRSRDDRRNYETRKQLGVTPYSRK